VVQEKLEQQKSSKQLLLWLSKYKILHWYSNFFVHLTTNSESSVKWTRQLFLRYFPRLSQADAAVIALAKEKKADLILSRDRKLRQRAIREGLAAILTTGLLILAKQKGFLPSVKTVLDEMRRQGILIRQGKYEEILRQSGEL
jgi:predicted nucleic acid-binding protein